MKYYVYELIDPRNSKIFYVGKGKDKRMYSHVSSVKHEKIPNRNRHLYNKIKQILNSGLEVVYNQIFFTNDNDEAFKKETKRIEEIGIKNLCNLFSSPPSSEEVYILRSKRMLGKIHSQETKQKISDSLRGHIVNETTKKKISDSKRDKKTGPCSELRRVKIAESKMPIGGWKPLLSPTGEIVSINILSDFCRKYGFRTSSISELMRGKYSHHKGWKVVS